MKDNKQRLLAINTKQSFVVQAPAGSGKTELLTQRYLALLSTVEKPEEIVALTFSKKAATEMQQRILYYLSSEPEDSQSEHKQLTYSLAKKALQRDKNFQWNILSNPTRLQISTIDSLAARLLERLPILSKFGSRPQIIDNPYFLYKEAVKATLQSIEKKPFWVHSLRKLFIHFDNQYSVIESLLINMLEKREQWLSHIIGLKTSKAIRVNLERALENLSIDILKNAYSKFPNEIEEKFLTVLKFSVQNNPNYSLTDLNESIRNLTSLPKPQPANKVIWQYIAKLLLTNTFSWRAQITTAQGFPPTSETKEKIEKIYFEQMKKEMKNILSYFKEKEDFRLALKEILLCPNSIYTEKQWKITQSLVNILPILVANLILTFKEHGKIDFSELNLRAIQALGDEENPTDLFFFLDYRIKHLLVDEFQDTSTCHYKLIEKLTYGWTNEEKTLFIVGDPMQSIYRFREAEVGLFLKIREKGINSLKLTPLLLKNNFRSNEKLINWCNTVFENSFPKYDDFNKGAIKFSSAEPTIPSNSNSSVQIHVCNSEEEEADQVIEIIKASQKSSGRQIAILARTRYHLEATLKKLKENKIPYLANDIDNLANKPFILDLWSLTKAIHSPIDKLAWLSVLRAPWCGLELSDLHTLSQAASNISIFEVLQTDLKTKLSQEGNLRINRIKDSLIQSIQHSRRNSFHKTVETVWLSIGGPSCLNLEEDLLLCDYYFELLEEFEKNNSLSHMHDFEFMLNRKYTMPKDNHSENLLEIMTIHKAKGLEFDSVILVGTSTPIFTKDRPLLHWLERPRLDGTNDLLIAPIKGVGHRSDQTYDYLYYLEKQKEEFEKLRLMYVAATRAKNNLHITVIPDPISNNNIQIKPASSSLIFPFWEAISSVSELQFRRPISEKNKNEVAQYITSNLFRLSSKWSSPFNFDLAVQKVTQTLNLTKQLNQQQFAGTITHKLFKLIIEKNLSASDVVNLFENGIYLKNILIQNNIAITNLDSSIEIIKRAVLNTIQHPIGKWILRSDHKDSECELALTTSIDNKHVNIIIDRTFIDENNFRWVIDYKTSEQDSEFTPNEIKEQHQKQIKKYAQVLKSFEPRKIKLGIYYPLETKWVHWDYDDM